MSEKLPVPADTPASGQAPGIGRQRNKITELGEPPHQCSYICGAEGDQNEEPIATVLFDPLNQAQR